MLNNGARSFSFNQNNQLQQSGEFSFAYDGYGRRTKKVGPSQTQYSIYDASGVLRSTYSASHGFVDYYYLGSQLIAKHADPNAQLDSPGYTGHIEDDDLELVYMQARYYDPVIGRFYSNDPVGFVPNSMHSFNRYTYANNNPYKYTDPNGEWAIQVGAGLIGFAIGAISEVISNENATFGSLMKSGGVGAAEAAHQQNQCKDNSC